MTEPEGRQRGGDWDCVHCHKWIANVNRAVYALDGMAHRECATFIAGATAMRNRIENRLREMIGHFKSTEASLVKNGKIEDSWTMRDHAEAYKNVLGVIEGVSKENLWPPHGGVSTSGDIPDVSDSGRRQDAPTGSGDAVKAPDVEGGA